MRWDCGTRKGQRPSQCPQPTQSEAWRARVRVVVAGQGVPGAGEVVILVDQAHVQAGRAGRAVVAVHAADLPGRARRDARVVARAGRRVQEPEQAAQVLAAAHAGQDRQHAGLVQRVLDALVFRERAAQGRGLFVQELAAGERLHHGDAHALGLAAAVEVHALLRAADGELPARAVVVGRIDAEHDQVQHHFLQQAVHHRRRVRGQADVAHDALVLQAQDLLQRAPSRLQVAQFVDAVQEPKVDRVGLQVPELPGPPRRGWRRGPASSRRRRRCSPRRSGAAGASSPAGRRARGPAAQRARRPRWQGPCG